MTFFSMLVMMLLGGAIQSVLPTAPWLGEIRPPVLLCLTVYYALTRKDPPLVAAGIAGLIQDALGPVPLGVSSLCFCGVALLIHRQRDAVFSGTGVSHLVFGALAAALATTGLYLLLAAGGTFHLPLSRVLLKIAGATLLGGALTPFVYNRMERLDRLMGIRGVRHG
jgi:rod shape-determining protein MreD